VVEIDHMPPANPPVVEVEKDGVYANRSSSSSSSSSDSGSSSSGMFYQDCISIFYCMPRYNCSKT